MFQETNNKKKVLNKLAKRKSRNYSLNWHALRCQFRLLLKSFFAVRKMRNKMCVPKANKFARNPGFRYATVPDSTQTRYSMPLNTVKSASKKKKKKRTLIASKLNSS